MAFGKMSKQDLIDAGLDPEEIKTSIKAIKDGSATKEDLTNVTNAMTAIQESIKGLEAKLTQPVVRDDKDKNNNNNQDDKDALEAERLTDPVGYLEKRINQSVAFTAVQATKTRMDLALDRAKMSNPLFRNDALRDEILAEWNQYKPEQFAANKDFDPDKLLSKICNMVKGAHAEEIQRDTDKKEGKFNMVAAGGGGAAGGGLNNDHSTKKPEDMMTDIEKKQAARYGMTPEQWIQAGKDMEAEEVKVMSGAGV